MFAVRHDGVGQAQFDRRAPSAVIVFGVAIVIEPQQAGLARTATATVQFQGQVGVGIDADADQTLCEARLYAAHQAVGPFFGITIAFRLRFVRISSAAVAGAVAVLTVVVDRAIEHAPGAVFHKPVGLFLSRIGLHQRAGEG